jgi:hypothetical protein
MKTIAAIAALAALLGAAPSFAEDAKTDAKSERATVAKAERRPTTVERWRGAPYLRSASYNDALIRQEALDKSLPVITTTPNFATTPTF